MTLCSDADMASLIESLSGDGRDDLTQVDTLTARHPDDPRLHFMRGSILAGRARAVEAHAALARAVALAPEFHIARYQLGFFELTSGEADQALATWGPLLRLPEEHYLRQFVEGMAHLVRDEFAEAVARMEAGIARNQENPPLNHDIRLLIGECARLANGESTALPAATDQSLTSLMLGQFGPGGTRH